MGSEWSECTVADIAAPIRNAIVGGPFGSNLVSQDYVGAGVPVIRGQNMGGRWVGGDFAFVNEAKSQALEANIARAGDIVFTQRGTLGQVSLVPTSRHDRYIVSQRQMKVTVNPDVADPLFYYYVFSSTAQQEYIRQHSIQTGVPHTNLGILRKTPVPLPPLEEQRAIAHILGTLDDKIELNRRMGETLEAMARALFKSWFVDFDPVRAKAEGRDTGLPQEIADLFPDSFEDSEMAEIPKGWAAAPLSDLIEVNPFHALRKGEVAPYLDMSNVPTHGHTPDRVIEREYGSGMRFANGDTLVARITPCLENGKTALVSFLKDGEIGWGSTEFIILRPKPPLPPGFAYCLARSEPFRDFAIQSMTGSSGRQRVPAEALSRYLLASPPRVVAEAYDSASTSLFARAGKAAEESRTLAALRDTLLPKLISGKLRVPDAERFVEMAV
ncbi:MAG: restriction endonuclease subunit S [Gemmatimonadaceae bacterium]